MDRWLNGFLLIAQLLILWRKKSIFNLMTLMLIKLANIAEGFGRHGKKDKVKFYRYARGSVYESLDWLEKAKKARVRKLITKKQYDYIFKTLKSLPKEINSLISYINSKLTI